MSDVEPGAPIRFVMSKWGDRPHWEFDALYLGHDEHGDWMGIPPGTAMDRPGAHVVSSNLQVGLVPIGEAPDPERWWAATFHGPGGPEVQVYVDIATPPYWDGTNLHTIDLDLDVIRGTTGRVWIDDEDEFAQHRVELGYPEDVTSNAMRSCDRVERLVARREPPYDGSHEVWLGRLEGLIARS